MQRFNAAATAITGVVSEGQAYSYPPHGLFIAVPASLLPLRLAWPAFSIATLAVFLFAARPYLPRNLWVAALSPASVICMTYGQYGLLTSALFLLAFQKRAWAAALLTFKPHIGFLSAIAFLKDSRSFALAALLSCSLIVASVAVFGPQSWLGFLDIAIYQAGRMTWAGGSLFHSQVAPLFGYGLIGYIAFATSALVLLARQPGVFTAATATMLVSPYGFHYDMPAVCLGFAVLISTQWFNLRSWEKLIACLCFASPGLVLAGTWVVPPVLLAGLWVQVRHSERRSGSLSGAATA